MTEKTTKKRSEDLAVENVKRIADLLRTERNDAIALAQVKREETERFRKLVDEARGLLTEASNSTLPGNLSDRIKTFLSRQ